MGSAFHKLYLGYSGTLTPTAPTAIRLWETFTFHCLIFVLLSLCKFTELDILKEKYAMNGWSI